MQEALKQLTTNRTCIVVAHRLSSIITADLVLVMDRGHIVEMGSHRELLTTGRLYRQLFEAEWTDADAPMVVPEPRAPQRSVGFA